MSDRDWSIEGDGGEPLHVYARGLDRRVAIRASGPVVLDADGLAKVISELTERLLIMSGRSGLLVMLAEIRALWEAGQENEMAAVAMALLTSLSVVEERAARAERELDEARATADVAGRAVDRAGDLARSVRRLAQAYLADEDQRDSARERDERCAEAAKARDRFSQLVGEANSAKNRAAKAEEALIRERAEHAETLAELGPPPVVDGRVLGGREAARAFRQELDRARAAEAELRRRVMSAIDVLEASDLDSDSARRCSNTILRAG